MSHARTQSGRTQARNRLPRPLNLPMAGPPRRFMFTFSSVGATLQGPVRAYVEHTFGVRAGACARPPLARDGAELASVISCARPPWPASPAQTWLARSTWMCWWWAWATSRPSWNLTCCGLEVRLCSVAVWPPRCPRALVPLRFITMSGLGMSGMTGGSIRMPSGRGAGFHLDCGHLCASFLPPFPACQLPSGSSYS